jgi:galactose oxidase-like protein
MAPVRSSVALTAALAACAAAAGCVPSGFDRGSCTATPPASITFDGPVRDAATAGQTYFQPLSATGASLLGVNHWIEAVEVPDGATVTASGVAWLPPSGMAGSAQRFHVRSGSDLCGHVAELAWSVRILPPIEITRFDALPALVSTRGTAVQLLAEFSGGQGRLVAPFAAPLASGSPLDVGVVSGTTQYRLAVTSPAGHVREQATTVVAQAPPLVTDPRFFPPTAAAGDTVTLSWQLGGAVTSLVLDPGAVTLLPTTAFLDVVGVPGVSYTLTARNDVGDVAAATISPVVLARPVISSFTASPPHPAYLGTTEVTAVFEGGTGELLVPGAPFLPVTSGTPVTIGPLHAGAALLLNVSNAAATESRSLQVTLAGPGTWEFLSDGPGVSRSGHTATRLADGRVLVAGGTFANWPTFDTTELWDPVDGTSTPGPRLLHARTRHAAALLADGRVLLAGGETGAGGGVDEAEVLDLRAGTATPAGSVGAAWWFPQLVALPDGAAVLHPASMFPLLGVAVLRFDPGASTLAPLTTVAGLGWVRSFALADGRVLLLSGGRYGLTPSLVLDPATGTLAETGAPPRQLTSFEAVALADGRILATDGQGPALVFDPASGTFAEAGAPTVTGTSGLAILLPGGEVLVVGTTSMRFDPAGSAFRETGGTTYRNDGPLVLLPDGTVVVTGGEPERYHP